MGRPSVSTTRSWRRWACRRASAVPKGAISHWVAKTDDGTRVVDVWETRAEYDRFAKEKIGSYAKEVGIELRPGDCLEIRSSGGGGWGPPEKRSAEARQRDREQGLTEAPAEQASS